MYICTASTDACVCMCGVSWGQEVSPGSNFYFYVSAVLPQVGDYVCTCSDFLRLRGRGKTFHLSGNLSYEHPASERLCMIFEI